MEQNDISDFRASKNPRKWTGLILIVAGILLLANKMGAPLPHWLFTWPVLLILVGILVGIKSRFHNPGPFIMMVVGGVFLVDNTIPELNFKTYILPAILIVVGLIYFLRPKSSFSYRRKWAGNNTFSNHLPAAEHSQQQNSPVLPDPSEYVEIHNAFGGIKRNIISKNFKGGEIHNFMSGTELNLLQADMAQPTVLEVHNIFGGTKLIVPSNWDIINEMSVVFGGIEDRRNINTGYDPNKIMKLKGTCIFGGVEVSSY